MTQRRNDDPRSRGYGPPHDPGPSSQGQQLGSSQPGGWNEQPGGQASSGSQQPSQFSGASNQYGGVSSGPAGSPYGTPYLQPYGDEQPYGSQRRGASSDAGGSPYGQYGGEYGQYGQASEQAGFRGQDFGRQDVRHQDYGRRDVGRGDFGSRYVPDPGDFGRHQGWNAQDFQRGQHGQYGQYGQRARQDRDENERRYSGHYGAVDDPSRIADYGDRQPQGQGGFGPQRDWNQRSRADQRSEPRDWSSYGFVNREDIYGEHSRSRTFDRDDTQRPGGPQQHHHDPDYHQWRSEQLQNFDNDYQRWRQERYRKFSDEFNEWRRQASNAVPPAQTRAGGPDTERAQASTSAALGGASTGSEGGDLKDQQGNRGGQAASPPASGSKQHNK